jgi:ribosome-binding protein aMBF1 (putative translation factor)
MRSTTGTDTCLLEDNNTCIVIAMSRKRVSDQDREHGRRIGRLIADRREQTRRSAPELAQEASVAIDTIRRLEIGRVPTPAFLTVARLAGVLQLSLDDLHAQASGDGGDTSEAGGETL